VTVWKAGMLAVALETSPSELIKSGHVYRVIHVNPTGGKFVFNGEIIVNNTDEAMLRFHETAHTSRGGPVSKFRPAVQDWQSEKQSKTSKLDDLLKGRIPA
jgi:hypothetical protein